MLFIIELFYEIKQNNLTYAVYHVAWAFVRKGHAHAPSIMLASWCDLFKFILFTHESKSKEFKLNGCEWSKRQTPYGSFKFHEFFRLDMGIGGGQLEKYFKFHHTDWLAWSIQRWWKIIEHTEEDNDRDTKYRFPKWHAWYFRFVLVFLDERIWIYEMISNQIKRSEMCETQMIRLENAFKIKAKNNNNNIWANTNDFKSSIMLLSQINAMNLRYVFEIKSLSPNATWDSAKHNSWSIYVHPKCEPPVPNINVSKTQSTPVSEALFIHKNSVTIFSILGNNKSIEKVFRHGN